VLLLERLRLFPVVFAVPPQNEAQLGQRYGGPCSAAMAATEALLKASGFGDEVWEALVLGNPGTASACLLGAAEPLFQDGLDI
jgi:hypothetical protein